MTDSIPNPVTAPPSPVWNFVRWVIVLAALGSLAIAVGIALGGLERSHQPSRSDREIGTILVIFGLPALMGFPVVTFLWAEAVYNVRRRRGQRVVAYLESAVRLDAPLPEMIRAMAASEKRAVARRLEALASVLTLGEPLSPAIRKHIPEVSPRQVELIGVAERTGRLRQTLTDLVRADTQQQQNARRWVEWLYPLVIAYILALMVAGLMVFIAPKFQEIFADFGMDLPTASLVLVDRGNMAIAGYVLALLSLLALGITIWSLTKIASLPRASRSTFRQAVSEFLLSLPFIGAVTRDRQLADVCYAVASSVRAAVPLPSALMEAGTLDLSPTLRTRVVRWAEMTRSGRPTEQAAHDAGLPSLLVGMLTTGQAAAQPAEAFDFLYRYYSGRFSRALELLRGALVPFTVLTMGVAIGWVVLAAFLPLAALISEMATGWGT